MKSYKIRPATYVDARPIYKLIKDNSDNLIVRALSDVVQNIDRFLVADAGEGGVIGAIAYAAWPEIGVPEHTTVELQSVCVDAAHRGIGVGVELVRAQLERIRPLRPAQIIVLTFTPEFFAKLGFHEIRKETIMHKLYMGCVNCTKHESPFLCPEKAMAIS